MTVEVTQETFCSLQKAWEALLPSSAGNTLFLTPLWQRTWWETMGTAPESTSSAELLLMAVRQEGELIGIAPLLRSGKNLAFLGSTDLFDYHDFVIRRGREETFYPALMESLAAQEWGQCHLLSVPQGSPTLTFLPRLAQERGWECNVQLEGVAPGLPLPETWDQYLSGLSKKDRHELRRKFRRLSSAVRSTLTTHTATGPQDEQMDKFFLLMRQGRADKQLFLTPDREGFFRAICQQVAQAQILRLCFLEIDNAPVAAALCFDYDGQRLLYNSGFSPEHAWLSVGLLLKAYCLRDAIEQKMTYFDFLRGDEAYKYDLGGQDRKIYEVIIQK
ncbi:MAG: GNAT family N-acetyltransferase [Chloroflexi bacterium]|nr:GNAT family N-acetyltransferase [Chloroflexota bacterium]